ncbi:MAG: P-II family nitrogen regulator [Myxococcaceae bacterium]|nr:P-II family nitrogen regulator [Myxococcaceae bacterium]
MKMIIALIRPDRLDAVEKALAQVLDEGDNFRLTIDTVEGRGRQAGEVEYVRGREVQVRTVQKTRLTIAVNEAYVEKTIAAIVAGAKEGEVGDGKIFVLPLDEVVRIRTGERGAKAI